NEKTNLRTVVLGSSVVWIGSNAFRRTGLTSCNFPASLKVIGSESFDKSGLPAVDLSACTSLVAIKYEAFEGTSTIQSVTFPAGSSFTFLGNDAFKELTSLTSVDMQMCTGITEFQSKMNDGSTFKTFYGCTGLKTVILPPNLTAVPDDGGMGVFNGCGNIETLTFTGTPVYDGCTLTNPCTIGDKAFQFNRSLSSITLSKNISYIGEKAFQAAAITEISIPASMEELAKHCFYGCTKLTTVIFEEFDKQYGTCDGAVTQVAGAQGEGGQGQGAFEECQAITDVYINTMAELDCINNAFDQDISWGAGDAGANFATLHFPKEKTEHYVNLSHYLTDAIVTDPGLFHDWLEDHYKQAIIPHKNGWYEFINSGPTTPEDGPVYQDIILRTFSDWDYAYLVPQGIRAYVVNKIELLNDGNYEVSLQRLNVIPKKTGVILYGHPNGRTQGGKPALVLTPVKFLETGDPLYDQKYNDAGELIDCDIVYNEDGTMVPQDTYRGPDQGAALCRANWTNLDEAHMIYKNYLEPIITADGSRVAIKPYETVKVGGKTKTTFRNFGLGRYTSTDYYKNDESSLNDETNYVGFFRMKPREYDSGYAYLRLRADVDEDGHTLPYTNPETEEVYAAEFPVASSGEILVKKDEPAVDVDNHVYPYYWEVMIKDGIPYDARANVGNETYNPKRWWDDKAKPIAFTWEEYSLSWGDRTKALNDQSALKYFGELEEDADGMAKVVIPADDVQDVYYTLQGVRVTNPTKGVYILNGKKVIVK
ncbi:MAG: leucine-rich repeat domain-containing protein, partial [Prevotella sp.]|nr:leucine-rich repeat domain-containing protein [Prevotella sp.]